MFHFELEFLSKQRKKNIKQENLFNRILSNKSTIMKIVSYRLFCNDCINVEKVFIVIASENEFSNKKRLRNGGKVRILGFQQKTKSVKQ
ncbi:hypothetical protein CAEBREN_21255 [Caenorhabditis brenneri]|uniref:Uncharacterized protein n=1 Tax=Caenorhabditis brenneri TaxID=135651 RepID=G0P1W6_CAEBE|nr:hypothetical protein CAEBREN_21255 [Caenorhabditis brenneri]